jgi:predicted nucleic acid-binding protein
LSDFYLDPSAIVPLIAAEPTSAAVERFVRQPGLILLVSDFGAAEMVSAVSRAVRTGRLSQADGQHALRDFDRWRATALVVRTRTADIRTCEVAGAAVRVDAEGAPTPFTSRSLSDSGATLVTLDERLATAAGSLGCPLRR